MGNTRVGIGIGLVVGALALQVPVAAADDSGLDIRSRQGAHGATVTVSTTACGEETYGKGESEVAGSFHLFEGRSKGVLTGEFTVPEGSSLPVTDTVVVKCPPRVKITDSYELTAHRPDGAVEAGFGATEATGPQLALGGALIAAAGAGWLVRVRHRSNAKAS
ncbi:sortase [Streptomyces phaeofaciens]|uniref:sortase n=1 Tax=Streptomyces phaeofaciens TaxID=68254 RepID=UPI0036741FFD